MSTGKIQVYYGAGRGKTSAALGYAIHEASKGESVIVIQFLKRKDEDEISFLGRLEPEIRLFRFQKSEKYYNELPDEGQLERADEYEKRHQLCQKGTADRGVQYSDPG